MHRLLSDTGTLYVHLDWHASAYARLLLDETLRSRTFAERDRLDLSRSFANTAGLQPQARHHPGLCEGDRNTLSTRML